MDGHMDAFLDAATALLEKLGKLCDVLIDEFEAEAAKVAADRERRS